MSVLSKFWSRYKPKPVWEERYRSAYFEQAGRNLLLAFVLSISLNPFYVVFLGNKDSLGYVVVEDKFASDNGVFYTPVLTDSQKEVLNRYEIISNEELNRIKEFENKIWWITITSLLGWCITSPRFMRGWKKLIERWNNE